MYGGSYSLSTAHKDRKTVPRAQTVRRIYDAPAQLVCGGVFAWVRRRVAIISICIR
jgi:hypothetical protein